jgi:hypothetical protein
VDYGKRKPLASIKWCYPRSTGVDERSRYEWRAAPLSGAGGSATGAILLMEQDGIVQSDEGGAEKPGEEDRAPSAVEDHGHQDGNRP